MASISGSAPLVVVSQNVLSDGYLSHNSGYVSLDGTRKCEQGSIVANTTPQKPPRAPILVRNLKGMGRIDALCVQECSKQCFTHLEAQLGMLGFHADHFDGHGRISTLRGRSEGVGVMVDPQRFPEIHQALQNPTNFVTTFYHQGFDSSGRPVKRATLVLELTDSQTGQKVAIASVHLLGGQNRQAGEAQLDGTLQHMSRSSAPIQVIAGDFNREPREVQRQMSGWTTDGSIAPSEFGKSRRIDHIFYRGLRAILQPIVARFLSPWASDHYPVATQVTYDSTSRRPARGEHKQAAGSASQAQMRHRVQTPLILKEHQAMMDAFETQIVLRKGSMQGDLRDALRTAIINADRDAKQSPLQRPFIDRVAWHIENDGLLVGKYDSVLMDNLDREVRAVHRSLNSTSSTCERVQDALIHSAKDNKLPLALGAIATYSYGLPGLFFGALLVALHQMTKK